MHSLIVIVLLLLSPANASASCTGCHASPPADTAHRLHSGLAGLAPRYGDTGFTERYRERANTYGYNCGNCHPSGINRHENGIVDIVLAEPDARDLKAMNRTDAAYDRSSKTCAGVYCHSSGGNAERTYVDSPPWTGQKTAGARCQACHGSPPSYRGTELRPNGHFNRERGSGHLLGIHWDSVGGHGKESIRNASATQMGCSTCHHATVTNDIDTTFVDPVNGLFTCVRCHRVRDGEIHNYAKHVNGSVDIVFPDTPVRSKAQMFAPPRGWKRHGKKGDFGSFDESVMRLSDIRYDPSERSCSSVACHLSAGRVLWSERIECDSCHGNLRSRH